ncbi:MAG: NAD(P)H-hydrate dehydratase [Lentimicrobium sp.]|nr:NAD(P)H-hydrate dehydratase [Lentimicrobium sp.]
MCALKILPAEKIREADAFTIAKEPISSLDLMERAAGLCFQWIKGRLIDSKTIKVICGSGNNGGDGLVISRLLHQAGANVEVFVIRYSADESEDFRANFDRLAEMPGLIITDIYEQDPEIEITEDDVVIDALFGTGLSRPLLGLAAEIVGQINQSGAPVISIDMPSGLFADSSAHSKNAAIVKADYTLSFQFPKMAFFAPENEIYVGEWILIDIGLHSGFIESVECETFLIEKDDCVSLHRKRYRFAHKGNFGHALLIAGQTGSLGAAIMASLACLRSGVGLLTTHVPGNGFLIMQGVVPEAMVSIDSADDFFSSLPVLDSYNAIGVGPGIGMASETQNALKLLIQQTRVPLVLDADAINILAENKTWLAFLPAGSILTPHLKEFERLSGPVGNHFDRIEMLKSFAVRYKLFVILKGAFSALATPEGQLFFNPTGNPGMATAGSGDVLTGVILGLLASGYPARDACILGMWLHGKAGDLAAKKHSPEAMIARDIIDNLGKAFKKLS